MPLSRTTSDLPQQTLGRRLGIASLRFVVFVAILYGYLWLVQQNGGPSAEWFYGQWLELLFVVYLYGFLYAILRPVRGRAVIAAAPILVGYLAHDVYFQMYGKVLRLVNIQELPELLQVLPTVEAAAVVAVLFIPLLLILAFIDYRRPRPLVLGALPLFLLVGTVTITPTSFAAAVDTLALEIIRYSDRMSVERNGRFTMLAYHEAQRISARERTLPFHDRVAYDESAAALTARVSKHANRRNVHLIVLESFLDPTLFRDARFSRDPMHPEFRRLVGDQQGFAISPMFGGATAQAEFEALCGVPALEQLSSMEFNVFTGAPVHCLPRLLKNIGYRTIASNAFKPDFFNTLPAYQGIGFGEIYFPREYAASQESYLSVGDPGVEEYAFDELVLEQNLEFVRKLRAEQPDQPLFNYVLTIYGHTPHVLDPVKRPEIIQVQSSFADDHLQRATNQYYYRTEAIARYVRELIEIDRNSLIILMGDHVPPLRFGLKTYDELQYMNNIENSYYYNRVVFFENGNAVRHPTLNHYELPQLILNYLTDQHYCRAEHCTFSHGSNPTSREDYLERYYTLMAHASE